MKDVHNFPVVNERITEAMKKLGEGKITSSLNKFRYRYRIARAFESIAMTAQVHFKQVDVIKTLCVTQSSLKTFQVGQ